MTDRSLMHQRLFAELKRRRVFRVMAWYGAAAFAVLQVADLVVPLLGLPESLTQVIALALLLGFPVAVVLEWAFELTPGGVRRTPEAAPGELKEIIQAPPSKRWPSGLLAFAGLLAVLAGVWYEGRQLARREGGDASAPSSASIAVLPFVNLSSDPEQDYFSDGISEELLNLLAQVPQLRVASRTSAFAFKGRDLELPEIARRLNVAKVLEGSVQKAGNRVRITAQLVDARTDTNLWSETWDRTLEDVFAVQDEIAAKVAERLQITLLGATPTVEPTNPDAYALFLQGRQFARQRTAEGFSTAIKTLKQALAIEPDYAPAWGELARVYSMQATSGERSFEEAFRLAREAADRALTIDPDYAPAIADLGAIAMARDGDLAAAARYYQQALALSPTNTDIIGDVATLLQSLGRLDEAITLKEYAVARDPVNPRAQHNLGNAYRWAGRWDEAISHYNLALSLSPGFIGAETGIGQALLGKGEPEAALEAIELESSRPWRLIGLSMAYYAMGEEAKSGAAVRDLIESWGRDAAYNIAYVLAFRGDADGAFEWLNKAVEYGDPGLSEISVESTFAGIQGDPRWMSFLERIGRSPEQLARIKFHVTIPK